MWSLVINGVTKSLAAWQVLGVILRRVNLGVDTLTFDSPRQNFDEDPLCAYGDTVELIRDGVRWFRGTNQTIPSGADPGSESQRYTISSPWFYLTQNIYQEGWYNGTFFTPHAILRSSIGEHIKRVLDYAIANGAALQYLPADLVALAAYPPAADVTDKYCASLITENLSFAPDTVVWFDYTTTPPTLRFAQRASLAAASVRMASYNNTALPEVQVVQLTPRYDLQVPSVKINFETTVEIDGRQYLIPTADIHPPGATGREDGALNATVPLQGQSVTNISAEIDTVAIEANQLAWWQRRIGGLSDSRVTVLSGPNAVKYYDLDTGAEIVPAANVYPNELPSGGGQIAEWMPVDWRRVLIKAKFTTQTIDAGDTVNIQVDKEYSAKLMTTNAPLGLSRYSTEASRDWGDPAIVGLAAYLYNSLSPLQWDMSFTLVENECSGAVILGNVVNLLGTRRPEHAAMRALVQEVVFSIDDGTTTVLCGPPTKILGISEVLALLQRFQRRRRWTNPLTQDTGELSGADSGEASLGEASGDTDSVPGEGVQKRLMVKDGGNKILLDGPTGKATVNTTSIVLDGASSKVTLSDPRIILDAGGKKFLLDFGDGKKVTIDAAAAAWLAGKELKVIEYGVCVKINNVDTARKALFIATDHYA